MKLVKMREAKTNLSKLIERACRGAEVVIARGATPVVRLVPIVALRGRRQPGALRGKFRVGRDFFAPLPPTEIA